MSKKDFSGGLSSLLGEGPIQRKETRGRKATTTPRDITKSSQEGTRQGETRATFIVKEDLLEKLKGIAFWEREQIKTVINQALQEYISKYEEAKGKIKPVKK